MTWVRIDDGFPNHPKIIGLSDGAFRLYITALCYSNAYLTDGIIPIKTVKKLSNSRHISALVAANLWEISEDEITILGYDEYQFTKERVESERKSARARMEKHRLLRRTNGEPTQPHTHPIPIPIPNKDIEKANPSDSSFELFWSIYPRRQGKGAAKKAWANAVKKVSMQEIIESAERFANDPNRDPEFTPHATTWLNQERWGDEALPAKGGKSMTRTESSVHRALEISEKFREIDF